jgi:membrane associated rhomboid family serine protease
MIPLRDNNPRRTTPYVNILLIVVNVWMFLWEAQQGPSLERILAYVAFVPARFWAHPFAIVPNGFSVLISMFLHGGWLHLGGNMLYLWIFGDNIEDRLGHTRYLIFYLLCGGLATFAHAFMNPTSAIPSIGASGAIAGVLGAYLVLFPRARVLTIIPIVIFFTIREVPALVVLGLWFVLQLFIGFASLGMPSDAGGVAYFAHIGGFAAGIVLVALMGGFRRKPAPRAVREYRDWR